MRSIATNICSRHKDFAKLDTNGDGKLSDEEYAAKAVTKFATADADHSGPLDREEFATTRVVLKTKSRCPPVAGAARRQRRPPRLATATRRGSDG